MYKIIPRIDKNGEEFVDIILTKGDTFITTVEAISGEPPNEPYIPVEGDTVRFALKRKYTDSESLIRKNIPISTMLLRLDSIDTKELDVIRQYVYDIEIDFADGRVDTFIKGIFILTNEVE